MELCASGDQTLAASTLSGGSATPDGSFAFTTPSMASNAGTAPHSVTFTATVTLVAPASTAPTGNVQFYNNGVKMGSPVALSDGLATLSTAELPAGTNTVLAA